MVVRNGCIWLGKCWNINSWFSQWPIGELLIIFENSCRFDISLVTGIDTLPGSCPKHLHPWRGKHMSLFNNPNLPSFFLENVVSAKNFQNRGPGEAAPAHGESHLHPLDEVKPKDHSELGRILELSVLQTLWRINFHDIVPCNLIPHGAFGCPNCHTCQGLLVTIVCSILQTASRRRNHFQSGLFQRPWRKPLMIHLRNFPNKGSKIEI